MKRSKCLLVSGILGLAYLIYIIYYYVSSTAGLGSADTAEAIGKSIGLALILPHVIFTGFAVLFNWLGWALNKRWGALVAGILYCVAGVLMIFYILFVLVQIILCFVAFARMKKSVHIQPPQEAQQLS